MLPFDSVGCCGSSEACAYGLDKFSILYRLVIDFSHISWAFGQFPLVITLWLVMQAQALVAFPLFQQWTQMRRDSRWGTSYVDSMWLVLYIGFLLSFAAYPIMAIHSWELPLASTIVVACEQVRISLIKCIILVCFCNCM